MWEESVGVPLIIAGPGVPAGRRVSAPVSLIDVYPTLLEWGAATPPPSDRGRPGRSLATISEDDYERPVMAEYHAVGSQTGIFMLRMGDWKLIHCVGDEPILYNLRTDPDEMHNLAHDTRHSKALRACESALAGIVDTQAASELAFRDQAALVASLGGEAFVRAATPMVFTEPPAP